MEATGRRGAQEEVVTTEGGGITEEEETTWAGDEAEEERKVSRRTRLKLLWRDAEAQTAPPHPGTPSAHSTASPLLQAVPGSASALTRASDIVTFGPPTKLLKLCL